MLLNKTILIIKVWEDLEFLRLKSLTWLEKKTITKQAQEKFHRRLSLNWYIYVACINESDLKTYKSLKVFVRRLSVRPYVCVRKLHFTIKAIVGYRCASNNLVLKKYRYDLES